MPRRRKNSRDINKLTYRQIAGWAVHHHRKTGDWPTRHSGAVLAAPSESWGAIRVAIKQGSRGLPGRSTLPRVLHKYAGAPLPARSRPPRPALTVGRIRAWAGDHRRRTGRWPSLESGPVRGVPGETWGRINACLVRGSRGLPGGSSLSRLLGKEPGGLGRLIRPRLTYVQILKWADEFHAKHGVWPRADSRQPIPGSPGDRWTSIAGAMIQGFRGLTKRVSLPDFLAERRGRAKNTKREQPLHVEQILEWADAHHRRHKRWPGAHSGEIAGTDELWSGINYALQNGTRSLPGGETLARLLARMRDHKYRRPRYVPGPRPKLSKARILKWARGYFEETGSWPTHASGPILHSNDETWSGVNTALITGGRGLPGGSSLSRLLDRHVPAHQRRLFRRPDFAIDKIAIWAANHCERTGRWPGVSAGPIPESPGDSWYSVNRALKEGKRGLSGGSSLEKLLKKHVGPAARQNRPPLTYKLIIEWAEAWRERTGRWPASNTPGRIEDGYGDTWPAIQIALINGYRGLPGGMTISKLLGRTKGSLRSLRKPRLTIKEILEWADAHHARTGEWPRAGSGRVVDADHEITWVAVDGSLWQGRRGLSGQDSLARLLHRMRGVPVNKHYAVRKGRSEEAPRLRIGDILRCADAYRKRHGDWPKPVGEPIDGIPFTTWAAVNKALREGLRGLPGGSSLLRLLNEQRGAPYRNEKPDLSIDQILAWADAHRKRTGSWPLPRSGPVIGAPDETWFAIQASLQYGQRGVPAGQSVQKLLSKHRGRRNIHDLPDLNIPQILAWADEHHRRTGQWPIANSGEIPGADGETWKWVASAMHRSVRGMSGKLTLPGLLYRERGVRSGPYAPKLSMQQILTWADAHHRRTGAWPTDRSGPIPESTGETWALVGSALRTGIRGLPGSTSLARVLEGRRPRGKVSRAKPDLKLSEVLLWARAFYRRHGRWPERYDGRIPDAPGETWLGIDTALEKGGRGLPGGSSLDSISRGIRAPRNILPQPSRRRSRTRS